MNKLSPVVAFLVFMGVFVLSRTATRDFLASWVALEGVVLGLASLVASVLLSALAAGAVLYVSRLVSGE
ncbi:phosphoglycerol transferase MdoB-like AlkP superfamily enzyme [Nocardiopsis terrae]|uniref:Phosphoglycerol transferase MdoB-like AlkP superfamily enzyme n=1 Tax=Nocardiopsis terrae TaxID=372655 RepID=A0ABR9HAY2_9ACTN|nr:hypothetical protein [Nocardiopsis terrae]MBE1456163.1 phosphoglycerol transferase MdoB-like AlkP superfamily enzyme [Nocardiopsis terrae]